MGKEKRVINIANLVATPILDGDTNNEYIWTGVPRADAIDSFIVKNEEKREEFIKLISEYEMKVLEYRRVSTKFQKNIESGGLNSKFESKKESLDRYQQVIAKLNTLANEINDYSRRIKQFISEPEKNTLDQELFWVGFAKSYEDIMKFNPNELKKLSNEQKKNLRIFKEKIDENIAVREVYFAETNKYMIYPYPTRSQDERLKRNKNSKEELINAIKVIAGKDEVGREEGFEILKELSANMTLLDLNIIFPDNTYAGHQYITVFKNYLLRKGYDHKAIDNMSTEEIKDLALEKYNTDGIEMHSELFAETIINGARYLDVEKMLLVAMMRPLDSYNCTFNGPRLKESNNSQTSPDVISEKIKAKINESGLIDQELSISSFKEKTARTEEIIKRILAAKLIRTSTKTNIVIGEGRYQELSVKKIEELMKNYCDGIYLTDITSKFIIIEALENASNITSWSDELVQRINFKENDIAILSLCDLENLKKFYDNGKIDQQFIKDLIFTINEPNYKNDIKETYKGTKEDNLNDRILENSEKVFEYLMNNNMIEDETLVYLFEVKALTIEDFSKIEEKKSGEDLEVFLNKMKNIFGKDLILDSYQVYIEDYLEFMRLKNDENASQEDIDTAKENMFFSKSIKDRNLEMYNRYNKFNSKEEKDENGDNLLMEYYVERELPEDFLKDSISIMYEDGLISLANIINVDSKLIMPMLDRLSLDDISTVREKMGLDEIKDLLDEVFLNDDYGYNDESKFIILMNLLDGEDKEEREALKEYRDLLDFSGEERKVSRNKGNTKNGQSSGNEKDYTKHVYPDYVKWKFYRALDKDCKVTRYTNGYVEFASNKLGVRFIEKYYDGNNPAYGTATYILSENDYKENEKELITYTKTGKVLETSVLREITPRKDRVVHITIDPSKEEEERNGGKKYVTWMDSVAKHVGISLDGKPDPTSRYTDEEKRLLEETVSKYKYSREEIR